MIKFLLPAGILLALAALSIPGNHTNAKANNDFVATAVAPVVLSGYDLLLADCADDGGTPEECNALSLKTYHADHAEKLARIDRANGFLDQMADSQMVTRIPGAPFGQKGVCLNVGSGAGEDVFPAVC